MDELSNAPQQEHQPNLSQVLKSVANAQRLIIGLAEKRNGNPSRDKLLNRIAEKERARTLAIIERDITDALLKIYSLTYRTNGMLRERVSRVDELSTFIERVSDIKEKMLEGISTVNTEK